MTHIHWPATSDALEFILDKCHQGEPELIAVGLLEVYDDGKYFVFQFPEQKPKRRLKPIHPGRWGHGD